MTQTADGGLSGASWGDRLFDAFPVAPVWVGTGIAIGLLALFVLLSAGFGGLSDFLAGDISFWNQREARLGVVVALLAAFVPTAERYARLGAKRHFAALLPLLGEREAQSLSLRFGQIDARRRRIAGGLGLLLLPITGFAIDRDPGLYLREEYWAPEKAWAWIVGALFCFGLGRFVDSTLSISRRFSELARVLAAIHGESGVLAGSAIARREGGPSLADLVAWKTLVDAVGEWPFDAGMRLRFLLYLAIPVGSWLGGALVERLLSAALD